MDHLALTIIEQNRSKPIKLLQPLTRMKALMNNTQVQYILTLSLLLCANGQILEASEKPNNKKLDQALRQFQDMSSEAALSALAKTGYGYKPKMEPSPRASSKAFKKNGATKASDSLDF